MSQEEESCIRRIIVSVVVACGLFLPATADARQGCQSRSCHERVAAQKCSQTRPVWCLKRAAIRYRQSFWLMYRIARCESGLRPWARNPSGAAGLMQFMPRTWASGRYGRRSVHSAKWNALAGAWLLRRAGTGPWTASRHCWG